MIKPKVIHISQVPKDWKTNDQYVYIGRSGKGMSGYFGNPIRLPAGSNRGATLEAFKEYAIARIEEDAEYREAVKNLSGKHLVCFCAPQPCHGDILAELCVMLHQNSL